jgi:hypothetical protein
MAKHSKGDRYKSKINYNTPDGAPPPPIGKRFTSEYNPAGKPMAFKEVLEHMKKNDGPLAVQKARELLESNDHRSKIWAIEFFARYAFGAPPKRPTTPPEDIPKKKEDILLLLEQTIDGLAIDGDVTALLTRLRALSPEKYGSPNGMLEQKDTGQKTKLNFVLDGQQREGHDPDDRG